MEKLKKYIIIVICFSIILVIALVFLVMTLKKKEKETIPQEVGKDTTYEAVNEYRQNSSTFDYFRVNKIIDIYYNFIKDLNGKSDDFMVLETEGEYEISDDEINKYENQQKEQTKKALLGMLAEEYIDEYKVTIENIEEKVNKYNCTDYIIDDMFYSEINENINAYFIKGEQISTNKKEQFLFMILVDLKNDTFSIYLDDYIKAHELDKIENGEKVDIYITEISDRKYNKSSYEVKEISQIVQEYFKKYKKMLQYDTEKLFNQLNKEYRDKKFEAFQNFNKYISENRNNLQKGNIVKYSKEISNNKTQYICIDQNGRYYIFQEESPMKFTIILDTYTIDLPEFTSEYAKASNDKKVLMNVQRVFDAINDGDYKYAYSKLDTTFKNNNFRTLESFTTYMQQNFFNKNKVISGKTEKQNDIYISTITINNENDATKKVDKSFVMQLKEGTDFVMSFNVN